MQSVCRYCKEKFEWRSATKDGIPKNETEPEHCGRLECRLIHEAYDDWWAGRVRMARARLAAGRLSLRGPIDKDGNTAIEWTTDVTDKIDRMALERAGDLS